MIMFTMPRAKHLFRFRKEKKGPGFYYSATRFWYSATQTPLFPTAISY